MSEEADSQELTAHDRCDKCSSQAYYLTIFDAGELYFCYHHFNQNKEALEELAYYIIDQSKDLFVGSNG
jgi:hypothetical protein